MKKVLLFILLTCIGLSASAYDPKEHLKVSVDYQQKMLPMDFGDGRTWVDFTYENNTLTYTYVMDEAAYGYGEEYISKLSNFSDKLKEALIQMINDPNSPTKEFNDTVKKVQADVVEVYKGKLSGDTLTITAKASDF